MVRTERSAVKYWFSPSPAAALGHEEKESIEVGWITGQYLKIFGHNFTLAMQSFFKFWVKKDISDNYSGFVGVRRRTCLLIELLKIYFSGNKIKSTLNCTHMFIDTAFIWPWIRHITFNFEELEIGSKRLRSKFNRDW